jgi:hypothetical protein
MTQGLGIVGAAFVVALALAPRSADAQQIFACVSNGSGAIKIVAPNATCSKNEQKLVCGGALAAADYQCVTGQLVNANGQLTFHPSYSSAANIGSAISPHPIARATASIRLVPVATRHLSDSLFRLSV